MQWLREAVCALSDYAQDLSRGRCYSAGVGGALSLPLSSSIAWSSASCEHRHRVVDVPNRCGVEISGQKTECLAQAMFRTRVKHGAGARRFVRLETDLDRRLCLCTLHGCRPLDLGFPCILLLLLQTRGVRVLVDGRP